MTTCAERHVNEVHGMAIAFLGLLLIAACCVAGPLLMVLVSGLW